MHRGELAWKTVSGVRDLHSNYHCFEHANTKKKTWFKHKHGRALTLPSAKLSTNSFHRSLQWPFIITVITFLSSISLGSWVDVKYLPLRRGLWVRMAQKSRLAGVLQNVTGCSRTSWCFWYTALDILCIGHMNLQIDPLLVHTLPAPSSTLRPSLSR